MSELLSLPPLSVYVHIPWCVRKCPYCDFNSHAADPDSIPVDAFVERFRQDLNQDAPLAQGRPITSVFFGGGTPSLLPAKAIGQILESLNSVIGFEPDAEITLEANPGTFEAERFADYRAAGVNRLSIGVQSFADRFLSVLGRIHSGDNAVQAIRQARSVGFDNLNIDLMHGLPEQSIDDALADLNQAIDLEPTHLSWYQLTIEQNTEFYRQPPPLPAEDTLWDIQQAGQALIDSAGYHQYEVSAYAQTDRECRHNLNYWQYGDFLGLGPGAHGKITRLDDAGEIIRTRKTRLPKDYLNSERPLIRMEEAVTEVDRPFDYFINTLRLRTPVSLTHFEQMTGLSRADIAPQLDALEAKGWIKRTGDLFSTSESGYLYLNEVLSYWLSDE
ncbi:radical SAM family heme chaperone HemW [Reinekea blandensis]|uniref:Heme chaperone HemW n=1 Tax=Reinekea blandensis MED297 TaxID=314283 RepID=A4BKD1_9GAMM|nr:radical SAM family heme chaperone HemW [Reinekea blandensis]EAR07436.1 coproporphyrinogen III oxidase [Reinekea sp. MED297] [Reinekea blandensis MED297]